MIDHSWGTTHTLHSHTNCIWIALRIFWLNVKHFSVTSEKKFNSDNTNYALPTTETVAHRTKAELAINSKAATVARWRLEFPNRIGNRLSSPHLYIHNAHSVCVWTKGAESARESIARARESAQDSRGGCPLRSGTARDRTWTSETESRRSGIQSTTMGIWDAPTPAKAACLSAS